MADELARLDAGELERRAEAVRERMRPLERDLAALRGERDVLLTELRRRERAARRVLRADVKAAMQAGRLMTVAELVASGESSARFEDFAYNLKTGGDVRLGYPGSRTQGLSFTDGVSVAQASDLARAAELYTAGWELGSPGRPGVRVHFPGTRQERLVPPDEVFVRQAGARPGETQQ